MEVAANFRKTYPTKDLELLWGALIKCYGTPALAEQAVFENPQILNPSYTFCNTMYDGLRIWDTNSKEIRCSHLIAVITWRRPPVRKRCY